MSAIPASGRTRIRDAIKALVSHIGLATDQTPFNDSQTALDPANAGASDRYIAAATKVDVDGNTFDASITINNRGANADFEGKTVYTIGAMTGSTRTDILSRTVRTLYIGLQDGDIATIGVRGEVQDTSP